MTAKKTIVTIPANDTQANTAEAVRTVLTWAGMTCTAVTPNTRTLDEYSGVATSEFNAVNNSNGLFLRVIVRRGILNPTFPGVYIYFQLSPDNTFTTLFPSDVDLGRRPGSSAKDIYSPLFLNCAEYSTSYQWLVSTKDIRITAYTHTSNDFYLGIGAEHTSNPAIPGKSRSVVLLARLASNVDPWFSLNEGLDTWGAVGCSTDADDMATGIFCGVSQSAVASAPGLSNYFTCSVPPTTSVSAARLSVDSLPMLCAKTGGARNSIGYGPLPTEDAYGGIELIKGHPVVYVSSNVSTRSFSGSGLACHVGDLHSDLAWGPGILLATGSRIAIVAGSEEYECLGSRPWVQVLANSSVPSVCPFFRVV